MILFQWIALPVLWLAFALDAWRVFRATGWRRLYALRAVLWATAALAIADPALTSRVAGFIGIGRGADLVLYLFVFAFLVVALLFYGALQRQQRQITELVRTLALQQARPPQDAMPPVAPPGG